MMSILSILTGSPPLFVLEQKLVKLAVLFARRAGILTPVQGNLDGENPREMT